MRNTLVKELTYIAEKDARMVLITGDLGYGVLDAFAQKFPSRFFNTGISEQAMASIAAGMALEGNIVFTYSIGNFNTLRCVEQIRNDICYHRADVKILSVGSGFSYGQLGMSHHATEDIAIMRALPNMRVYVPCDPEEAVAALHDAVTNPGPCYIRLAKSGEPNLYEKPAGCNITRLQELRLGQDVCVLGCGPLLVEGLKAAEILYSSGISVSVYSVPCVKPLDTVTVEMLAQKVPLLVTLEEHQSSGGLGSAVSEKISSLRGARASLLRLGLKDEFTSIVGSHDYLCEHYGLSAPHIAEKINAFFQKQ